MEALSKTARQVLDCLQEHRGQRALSAEYYYYMYCCSGRRDIGSQEAFEEELEELLQQGLIRSETGEEGQRLYIANEAAEEKEEISFAFASLQHEFQTAGLSWLSDTAKNAMLSLMPKRGLRDPGAAVKVLILAASIGTEGRSPLNPPEKAMVNSTFGSLVTNSMDIIYSMMEQELDEEAFGMMTYFCNTGGRETGMNLLRFILAFAYADGDLSPELARKIEKTFAPVLKEEKE